jgi:hypothetical protein
MRRTLVLAIICAASIGCAQAPPPRAKAPPPPDPIVTAEKLAFDAERQINGAEEELAALHPDAAVERLDAAERSLSDPRVDRYPDAERLRERHTELTARLPAVREEVRKRELAAAIVQAKTKIEAGRAALKDAIAEIKKKDPDEATLKRAADSVEAVRTALEEAGDLDSKDLEYSKYALNVRKDLQDKKKLVEQRTLEVSIDRGRSEIAAAFIQVGASMKKIQSRDVVDADFDAARASVEETKGAIGKSDPLGSRDAKFGKYLSEVKEKLETHKTAIEKRRHEVDISRHKGRVEESRRALADSMKKVKAPAPVEGDLEEAKNAVAVVEKSLDEAEPMAAKDRDFAKWVLEVRKSMAGTRSAIEQRKLEVEIAQHRALVSTALANVRALVGGLTTADDVKAAEAAVGELEKTLEAGDKYGGKDIKYSKFAIEARKTAVEAHKKIREHSDFLAMESQKNKVEDAITALKSALGALEGFSVTEEQFKATFDAVAATKKTLDDGAELEKKLARYNGWAVAKRKWLEDAETKAEKRKTAIALRQQRMLIEQTFDAAKGGVQTALSADATVQMVEGAVAAIKAAREELSKGAELERNDRGFATFVAATRTKLDKLDASLAQQKSTVLFREGAISALSEGLRLTDSIDAQGPEDQQKSYQGALEKFQACKKDGAAILADHPVLARSTFAVGRKKVKAPNVLSMCGENAKAAEMKLAGLEATVAFIEGPAKSFTKAKALLDEASHLQVPDAKKKMTGEALTNFEECVEKGKILQHKHPELSKAKFDIEGQVLTLPFVLTSCQNEAKELRVSSEQRPAS